MLTCYADVVRRARDVGQTLPDEQRIALGLTLIRISKAASRKQSWNCGCQAYDAGGRARAMTAIVKAMAEAKAAGVDPQAAAAFVGWADE